MDNLLLFAQRGAGLGRGDNMIVRVSLLLMAALLTYLGVMIIRGRQVTFRKLGFTLRGVPAVLVGVMVVLLGGCFGVGMVFNFFIQ